MEPRPAARRWTASASTAVAALTTVVYVALIRQEGNNPFWDIFPWLMVMLIGTSAALAAALAPGPAVCRGFAIAATVILGSLGVVAMFSIGIGFILAAILAGLAAAP